MQTVAAIMGSLVVVYMTIALYSFFQQLKNQHQKNQLAHELLRQKIKTASIEGIYFEQARLCWNGTRKFVVTRKTEEANDICSFELKPHDGKILPLFQPGQFLTFQLHLPGQEKPVIRCYSLSDCPSIEKYRVTIKKVPDGLGSGYFHNEVQQGTILDVQSPRGSFCINPTTLKPMVFIAGGVGVTPFLSMLSAIEQSRSQIEIFLFYAVQSQQDLIQSNYLQELANRHENIHVFTGFSKELPENIDKNKHFTGHLTVEYMKSILPSNNYNFYLCGPPPMMESLINGLNAWKVPKNKIHSEAFGTSSVKASKKIAEKPDSDKKEKKSTPQSTFSVTFKKSQKELKWKNSDEDLLSFAEAAGISVEAGCRAGSCGSCETAIQSGSVSYLKPPGYQCPLGSCLPCVAIPDSPLELDL